MNFKNALLFAAIALGVSACDFAEHTSTGIDAKKQEEMALRSSQVVGMPSITQFAEKRMMKDILESRDRSEPSTTYVTDTHGKLHKRCNSIGYGLPYSTQFTNPQVARTGYNTTYTIPQADPNGLFSPGSAEGTWVLCVNPKTGKARSVYFEDRITVSPFPLDD